MGFRRFIRDRNSSNLIDCILAYSTSPDLHIIVTVRITSRHDHSPKIITHNARNSSNLVHVNIAKKTSDRAPCLKFATWNIRSLNKKASSVCDLVIPIRGSTY